MTQEYDIILDGQLGQRAGTLIWSEAGGNITGSLSLLGYENPVHGKRNEQRLELTHQLRTAVRTLDCKTILELHDDTLSGVVTSAHTNMNFHGTKAKKEDLHEISKQD